MSERTFPLHAGIVTVAAATMEPGTTTLLLEELRGLGLPAGRGQVWDGGEAPAMRDLRRYLGAECAAEIGTADVLGYWRHRSTPEGID